LEALTLVFTLAENQIVLDLRNGSMKSRVSFSLSLT